MRLTLTLSKPRLWDYLSSCYHKVRYGHAQTAENACRRMNEKGSGEMEPYRCRYCGGWHIGH